MEQRRQDDARKLAELLRLNNSSRSYHGEHGIRTLKELSRSYLTITKDSGGHESAQGTVSELVYSLCRQQVYAPRHRSEWLSKITEAGVRRRAEYYYQQLDALQALRHEVRRIYWRKVENNTGTKLLRQIPCIGPIRAALVIALIQTPHRFRTKRQLWNYSGLGIQTRDSAQYRFVGGGLQRSKRPQQLRGLNENHNHDLKNIFKGAATMATISPGPFHDFYEGLLVKEGSQPWHA